MLSREVRYLPAYPAVDRERALPVPRSWLRPKPAAVYAGLLADEIYDQFDPSTPRPEHPTQPVDAFGVRDAGTVWIAELRREHPARNQTDRRRGGAGRRDVAGGRDPEPTSSVWTQQVLAAGQTLAGLVAVPATDAAELHDELALVWRRGGLGLGRSAAGAAGGWPDVEWDDQRVREIPDAPRDLAAGQRVVVWLTSPAVVRDSATGATGPAALDTALHELTGDALVVRDRHVGEMAVQGVNRWWGTITPVARAAAAGSVLLVEVTAPVRADEVLGWEHQGLGERQRDGFGRLLITDPLPGPLEVSSAVATTPKPRTAPPPPPLAPASFLLDGLRAALDHEVRRHAVAVGRELAKQARNMPGAAVLGRARQLQARRGQITDPGELTRQALQDCTLSAPGVGSTDLVTLLTTVPPTTVAELGSTLARGVLPAGWDAGWLSRTAANEIADDLVPSWWQVTVAAVLAELHRRVQDEDAARPGRTGVTVMSMQDQLAGRGGHRDVVAVWRLAATATVRTPVHPGAGDSPVSDAYPVDLAVVRGCDGSPMVPGTTLRGLLRHHLADRLAAWGGDEPRAVRAVFGDADDDGHQGRVCVLDATVEGPTVGLAVRNRIDQATGAAARGALFDMELLPAGANFPVHLEVAVHRGDDEPALLAAVVAAAAGLDGELGIRLGRSTNRGYGRLSTGIWRATRWSLNDLAGAAAWDERDPAGPFVDDDASTGVTPRAAVTAELGDREPGLATVADQRRHAVLDLVLTLPHGLDDQDGPGATAAVGGQRAGTSVAGPIVAELRRALRAVAGLSGDPDAARGQADSLLRDTFGGAADDLRPSRCRVEFATVIADDVTIRPRVFLDQHSAGIRHLFHDSVLTQVTLQVRVVVREPVRVMTHSATMKPRSGLGSSSASQRSSQWLNLRSFQLGPLVTEFRISLAPRTRHAGRAGCPGHPECPARDRVRRLVASAQRSPAAQGNSRRDRPGSIGSTRRARCTLHDPARGVGRRPATGPQRG
ncbi:MAG: RAMP superfamily CRISPR-associated protein [Pseudonocardiaceae bacterium]